MRNSFSIGAIAFALSFLVFGLAASWTLDVVGWDSIWLHYLFDDVTPAGFAVLIGLALGRLTARSVVFCSLGMQLAVFFASVAILATTPYQGGYPTPWLGVFGSLTTPVTVLSLVIAVVSPVVWLLVFRRVTPRLHSAVRAQKGN